VPPLKILFVSPEVDPFVKVGGLADMVGSLPKVLAAQGHDVRVVCPAYGSIKIDDTFFARDEPLGVDVGAAAHWGQTWQTHLPHSQVPLYCLEHGTFFDRPEVYAGPWGDHPDNDLRFIFLCRGALTLCQQLGWIPDVIHCHDWTTGFIPLLLNTVLRDSPIGQAATVMTIHNLEHQGYCDQRALDFARVPVAEFREDSTESHGRVNMMKTGLYHSTKLTTVSPTYSEEIKQPEGGFGLDHVLRFRAADLVGIVNGIDTDGWNPATDKTIPSTYTAASFDGKSTCKAALQKQLGLSIDPSVPLFGVVSRFATQKGLDLLAHCLPSVLEGMHVQFAVLGSGDAALEAMFREASARFPQKLGLHVGFNAQLAKLMQAGSDFFVMPSRAEPCGLTQLYAMRYGTPPIVRATGGLIDTVDQYQPDIGEGTGFKFEDATALALANTIGWACSTYYDKPGDYLKLRRNGMARDFSWGASAAEYLDIYRWAIAARKGE